MREVLGIASEEALFAEIPPAARLTRPLALPPPLTEMELQAEFAQLARRNRTTADLVCFLGGGYYDRFIPAAVPALVGRGEFLTAYTPYQPELSQGTLQATYEFQSMIAALTEMDVAQASLYDGASALAEAALLAVAHTERLRVVAVDGVNPLALAVVETYLRGKGARLDTVPAGDGLAAAMAGDPPAAVLAAYPDLFGRLTVLPEAIRLAHGAGALAVAMVDPIALALVAPPGQLGADIAVGEAQALGSPLQYGGPGLGFFAVSAALVRRLPGRLVGATVDRRGRRGYVLTLQAREQHIRREKATSNICSNHALNALAATVYLALLGPQGLQRVAQLSAQGAHYLARRLQELGIRRVDPGPFLFEFVVRVPGSVAELNRWLLQAGILGGWDLGTVRPEWQGLWQLAVTEKRTRAECDRLVEEVRAWLSR